jgi:hypothetical protein
VLPRSADCSFVSSCRFPLWRDAQFAQADGELQEAVDLCPAPSKPSAALFNLAQRQDYHQMACNGERFSSGDEATLSWTPTPGKQRTSFDIAAEVRPNAVWRRGRLFLRCPACQRRATRLYVPREDLPPRCRRCWGLSYQSQSWSYKPTGPLGALLGSTAALTTAYRRRVRRVAAKARYAARRPFLQGARWNGKAS